MVDYNRIVIAVQPASPSQRSPLPPQVAIEELISLVPDRLRERVLGVGVNGDQAIGDAEELVDRPGGVDGDADPLDLEIGVVQRRVGEERPRGQRTDQLGEVEGDLR